MSNIPTKGQFANAQATKGAAAQKYEDDMVAYLTDDIVTCMYNGYASFSCRFGRYSGKVLARVQAAFAVQGWTISVSNRYWGCTVTWS